MKVREAIEALQKVNPEATLEEGAGDEVVGISYCEKNQRVSTCVDHDDLENIGPDWVIVRQDEQG